MLRFLIVCGAVLFATMVSAEENPKDRIVIRGLYNGMTYEQLFHYLDTNDNGWRYIRYASREDECFQPKTVRLYPSHHTAFTDRLWGSDYIVSYPDDGPRSFGCLVSKAGTLSGFASSFASVTLDEGLIVRHWYSCSFLNACGMRPQEFIEKFKESQSDWFSFLEVKVSSREVGEPYGKVDDYKMLTSQIEQVSVHANYAGVMSMTVNGEMAWFRKREPVFC